MQLSNQSTQAPRVSLIDCSSDSSAAWLVLELPPRYRAWFPPSHPATGQHATLTLTRDRILQDIASAAITVFRTQNTDGLALYSQLVLVPQILSSRCPFPGYASSDNVSSACVERSILTGETTVYTRGSDLSRPRGWYFCMYLSGEPVDLPVGWLTIRNEASCPERVRSIAPCGDACLRGNQDLRPLYVHRSQIRTPS